MKFEEVSRQKKFEGRAFDVSIVKMLLPENRTMNYDLVEHPNAVTVLPIDAEGNMLFVKQFRLGSMGELLEFPAGVLSMDEDPGTGALRELREETGMGGQLELLGSFYLAAGYSDEKMFAYLATDLYQAPLAQDDDEYLELVKLPIDRVLDMVRNNEINDAKTLAVLLLASDRVKYLSRGCE